MKRLQYLWPLGIRTQLTLWYTLVFALLILLASFVFYFALRSFLLANFDASLQLRTQQIASGITTNANGTILIQDVTGDLPGLNNGTVQTPTSEGSNQPNQAQDQADIDFGALVRILDQKGQVVYITPEFRALTVPSSSVIQPLHGLSWQGTITARDGQQVRLYGAQLTDNETPIGVVQVAESLDSLNTTMQSVVLALLFITPFILILGAAGSYWLARRAFVPIHQLTRTARDIEAGDLQLRVPVPQAKDEVQDLALTLNEMIGRLDKAFAQQRRFVADASHELRTPVAVIRNVTDVALTQSPNLEECIAVLHDINTEAERLGLLITDLLLLARSDEGQIQLDREPVRLDLLVTDLVETMEPLAVERSITLKVQRLEPVTVQGDTARLMYAIMGLVDNALTYTNAGGTVALTVEACSNCARLAVHDTGIGIAPADVAHIFERFYRTDPARSRAVGGSGLGLSIVDWVIRAHAGSVAVESKEGQGSTFIVILPLSTSEG